MSYLTRPSNVRVCQIPPAARLKCLTYPVGLMRHIPAKGLEPLTSWSEAMRSIH